MTHRANAMAILDQIHADPPKPRFLQSWDSRARVLRYACGDERIAVIVGSDGSTEPSAASRATKLAPSTVRAFLDGRQCDSPFTDVRATLRDHVYLPDDRLYDLFAGWIAATYVHSMFSHFGYLFVFSKEARCGKTRAEEIVSQLAFEATEPRNAPTPPSMRETAGAGGTAIFDTLERWKDKSTESFSAAMEILDAGFRNGGVVTKMVPAGNSEWKQEKFPVYAPYMFAAIERKSLSDTALDRSFQIEMRRKSTRLKKKACDSRCESACEPVREQLYLFSLLNAKRISDEYESQDLQRHMDTLGLNDRATDIWRPLLATIKVMAPQALIILSALAQEMSQDPDRQEECRQLRILSALKGLAGPGGTLTEPTQKIVQQLKTVTAIDEVPDLHDLLLEWGFKEKSVRLPGVDTPRRAWDLTETELAAVEKRLTDDGLPPESATTTTTNADSPLWRRL